MTLEDGATHQLPGQDSKTPGQTHHPRRSDDNEPTFAKPPLPASTASHTAAPGLLAEAIRRGGQAVSEETTRQAHQIVGEWSSEIRRNGLTAASLSRGVSSGGTLSGNGRRTSLATSRLQDQVKEPGQGIHRLLSKRPSDDVDSISSDLSRTQRKRSRLGPSSGLSLGPLARIPNSVAYTSGLTSPLFFSNSIRHMMSRPPSFTASEAAASILGSEPTKAVTTLNLPKGQVSSGSSARSTSTPGHWSLPENTGGALLSPDGGNFPLALQQLEGVGVIELLEQDERPTFIVDLANSANFSPGSLRVIFANAALRAAPWRSEILTQDTSDSSLSADFSRFRTWIFRVPKHDESAEVVAPFLSYGSVNWKCSTIQNRFRIVSGNANSLSMTPASSDPLTQAPLAHDERVQAQLLTRHSNTPKTVSSGLSDYFGEVPLPSSPSERLHVRSHSESRAFALSYVDPAIHDGDDLFEDAPHVEDLRLSFDWTRIPLDSANLSTHVRFARSVDWGSTPLGPLEYWPPELRLASNLIMGSPHPAAMYWGPEFIAIYNEAYVSLAGQKHPQLMGSRYQDAWHEIWHLVEGAFESAWHAGQATMKHDDRLFMTRDGFVEETFFNWSLVPLVGADGSVVALYNPAFENTRRKVNERRMLTLREVGEKTSQAREVSDFWDRVKAGLEYNEYDVPFALIYSVSEDSESENSSMHSGTIAKPPQIVLEGALGAPPNHPAAASSIDLRTSEEGFACYLRDSMSHPSEPVVLSQEDGTLPEALIKGLTWRGFGDPCRTIVIFPVHPTTAGDAVIGFIVLGVNPRRPYNDDYKLFVNLLSRQLATSLASVVLFEEEIKRGQKAARIAALDRQELSTQLRLRTQEAVESEYRFTRMAEFAPVGMFIADEQGIINYCNEMWWIISNHPRLATKSNAHVWMQSIRDEDRAGVMVVWDKLVKHKEPVTHEFRFKGSHEVADGHIVDTWVLMSAYPERDVSGDLKSIFGCLTDISQQKLAESIQKQRRDEAVELKRQQENFIDITSHEMRNPLSAILQCADEISGSLTKYLNGEEAGHSASSLDVLLDNSIDAANTIALCANHQKRIVDDILTLSKLDSQLLMVTPVDVEPVKVVENVLKMFEAELKSHDIVGEFNIDKTYADLGVKWCKLDPSRLRQVMINLMTNAIKFTQGRQVRQIVINLGASLDPSGYGTTYFPTRKADSDDITDGDEWGDGEKIFLHLAVKDTGPGLDEDEKKILFQRFSQASPRTHVQYGGSGLGLFICRILTELLGGQIGVTSKKGVGSTFAFYIKSRRASDSHHDVSADGSTKKPKSVEMGGAKSTAPELQHPINTSVTEPRKSRIGAASARQPAIGPSNSQAFRPLDILIVEDNLVNQKVLERQLRVSGNNTFLANHGGEALEMLRRSRFWGRKADRGRHTNRRDSSGEASNAADPINISVILMDLEMPVMDGMTCTRKIRELEEEGTIVRHIPIIAVTAYARPEQIADAKAAGADDVISKPFRIPDLIPKIEELVTRYNTATLS